MRFDRRLSVTAVADETGRHAANRVLDAIYRDEKGWSRGEQVAQSVTGDPGVTWLVAYDRDRPVGVLRILFDLPLALYRSYGYRLLVQGVDVEAFLRDNRIAEVGRFAVLPAYRRHVFVVAALMRAAVAEIVDRRCTHILTDVFEDDPHTPLQFHTKVIGFVPVATHETGELDMKSRRITLILDIRAAYARLKARHGFIYRYFTEHWPAERHALLSGAEADRPAES